MYFKRRLEPNGIKKGSVVKLSGNAAVNFKSRALKDSNRHTVAYGYGKGGTVVVEYVLDPTKDMFQVLFSDYIKKIFEDFRS